jgi:hypothetical protein
VLEFFAPTAISLAGKRDASLRSAPPLLRLPWTSSSISPAFTLLEPLLTALSPLQVLTPRTSSANLFSFLRHPDFLLLVRKSLPHAVRTIVFSSLRHPDFLLLVRTIVFRSLPHAVRTIVFSFLRHPNFLMLETDQ